MGEQFFIFQKYINSIKNIFFTRGGVFFFVNEVFF